jgi:hypothetical protein
VTAVTIRVHDYLKVHGSLLAMYQPLSVTFE